MYKKYTEEAGMLKPLYHKLLLIMRLTTVILIASLLQVSAATFGQRITINQKNVTLEFVLKEIRKQSGYDIFFDSKIIPRNQKINVEFANSTLKHALNSIFEGSNLNYAIDGNIIYIKKEESFSSNPIRIFENIELKGVIKDESGKPMHGATLIVYNDRGFKKTLQSNSKGEFELPGVPEDAKLLVNFIGYKSFRLDLKNAVMPLEIKLSQATSDLEEVGVAINTGYLKITPLQSTGAVSQITTKQYESQINVNFLDGLQNKLPGLLLNNDVKFQGNSLFQVRGISTFSANSSPLIVVDGYPTNLSVNNINPNEVKSVTLLKDAAAAAIYGVKASNGVLVIERKEAIAGKPQVSFRSTIGFQPHENYSKYRWAPEDTYIKYFRESYLDGDNVGSSSSLGTMYQILPGLEYIYQKAEGVITKDQMVERFNDLLSYSNINDYERLFLRTALSQAYNIDISGGNGTARYYVTGNYANNKANQVSNNNDRFQLSSRMNLDFSKRFSLQLISDFSNNRTNTVPVPDINNIYPWERFQNEDGSPAAIYSGSGTNSDYNDKLIAQGLYDAMYYPLVDIKEISTKNNTLSHRLTGNFTYNIGNGFNLLFGGIHELSKTSERYYASGQSSVARQMVDYYAIPDPSGKGIQFRLPIGGYLKESHQDMNNFTARAQLSFNRNLGKDHKVSAIMGTEINKTVIKGNLSSTFGYDDQTLIQQPVDYKTLATVTTIGSSSFLYRTPVAALYNYSGINSQTYTDDRFLSGYANAYYTFRSRYSATGSLRIDQSNLFGTDPRYRYKPLWSLGLAWNIQQEEFMKDVEWVHNLKLRVSEGFNGNVAKLSIPQTIASAKYNNTIGAASLGLSSFANGGLRWEQTSNFNLGLDFSIFKSISGSIDYYNKKSTDLLTRSTFANSDPTTGTGNTFEGLAYLNQGSILNQGLEININMDWITTKRFNWYTGFILAANKNKVVSGYGFDQERQQSFIWPVGNNVLFIPGYSTGAMFSYRYAGLDATGLPKIYDQNGQVIEKPGSAAAPDGKRNWIVYSGTSIPVYSAGMSNRFDIGNFYLYFKLDFYGGNKMRLPSLSPTGTHPISGSENYWRKPGDENFTNIPDPFSSGTLQQSSAYSNGDIFVVNASYITLSALTFSYNLGKQPFIQKMGLKRFELLFQANNLYTRAFNKYNFSPAVSFVKPYITPGYTIGLYTDF